jgi:hypothetical protein
LTLQITDHHLRLRAFVCSAAKNFIRMTPVSCPGQQDPDQILSSTL